MAKKMQTLTLHLPTINDSFTMTTDDLDTINAMRELDKGLSRYDRELMLANIIKRIERNYMDLMYGSVDSVEDEELGEYTRDDFCTDCLHAAFTQHQLQQ